MFYYNTELLNLVKDARNYSKETYWPEGKAVSQRGHGIIQLQLIVFYFRIKIRVV